MLLNIYIKQVFIYIQHNFFLFLGTSFHSVTIATQELLSSHTSEYLGEVLADILNSWEISSDKVVSVTTDNGANMVGAVTHNQEFGIKQHIRCFAHTINLVAECVTVNNEQIAPLIDKVRVICKWAKRSVTVSDMIRKAQRDNGVAEGDYKKLILDVRTRWNSCYYMLEKYLVVAEFVTPIQLKDSTAPLMISAQELDAIKQLVELLKPLEFVTKTMSGEKYVTVSQIIPMINCCTKEIESINPK